MDMHVLRRICLMMWMWCFTKGELCPTPSVVSNGIYTLGPESMNVTYGCMEGHYPAGATHAVCVAGAWSSPAPPCVAPGCEDLYALSHGYMTLTLSGAVASFRCEEGYTLHGEAALGCNGQTWNGTQPDCRADEPFGNNGNGNHHHNSHGHHSRHHRTQHKTQHQIMLEQSDYSCIEPATVVSPPSVLNGVGATKWSVLDGIPRLYTLYRCKWGFSLHGHARTLYCQKGTWVGTMPKCVFATITTSVASSSLHQGDDPSTYLHSHDDWVRYADYTCFSRDNHVTAPDVAHAQLQPRFKTIEGLPHLFVQYECDPGYSRQAGEEYLYCKDEEWLGDRPVCKWNPNDSRNIPTCERNNGGCHQRCEMKHEVVTCSCQLGYRLGEDGVSCSDINECETNNGGCEQLCFNTDGHFRCGCKSGFYVAGNGRECALISDAHVTRDRPPLVLFHGQ